MPSFENLSFITALLFFCICLILFFIFVRKQREVEALQQELDKNINIFNQLLNKYERIKDEKTQLGQQVVKAQTLVETGQIRLSERDEKILYLQKELDKEQLRCEQVSQLVTGLKERLGVVSTQAESFQQQLNQSRAEKEKRDCAWADLNQKHTALQQELTELKVTLSEKEKILSSNNKIFLRLNNC